MPTLPLPRSRGGRSRRTTSTAPTMPRRNIKSAIGGKMNLLSGTSDVNLLPTRTASTENKSYDDDDDEDYTYADGTVTMATTEAAVAGLVQSVRDMFKCVMHVADPQCTGTGANRSGEVGDNINSNKKKKKPRAPSRDDDDDDDTFRPPTKITVQPTSQSSKTRSKQNQFKRKPLVEDMESLVRVRLRKPLGIIFASTRKNTKKGVRIYDLPIDGNAYRKAKPSLAVGDQLLSVNGVDMTQRSFESAMNYINTIDTSKHKMDLIFRRASFHVRV